MYNQRHALTLNVNDACYILSVVYLGILFQFIAYVFLIYLIISA